MVARDLLHIAVIVFGVSLAGIGTAFAYPKPSAGEIATCTPDAFRVCIPQVGLNRAAIFRCMRENKWRLSVECRRVFERHRL